MSNDLLEDSAFDLLGVASDLLAEGFNLGEEDAFTVGTGSGRPRGIMDGIDGTDRPASVKSADASALTAAGIINLEAALPAQYERNAKFMASKATFAAIRGLKDKNDRYLWPIEAQYGSLGIVPPNLLGYPILKNEFMPAVAGNAFPLVLADLGAYVVVDRVGFSIQRLAERYAEENLTLLLARKRVGGDVAEAYRIKAQKITA